MAFAFAPELEQEEVWEVIWNEIKQSYNIRMLTFRKTIILLLICVVIYVLGWMAYTTLTADPPDLPENEVDTLTSE